MRSFRPSEPGPLWKRRARQTGCIVAIGIAILAGIALTAGRRALAQYYKCESPGAATVYSQVPCSSWSPQRSLRTGRPSSTRPVCARAGRLASHIAARLRGGEPVERLVNEFGGSEDGAAGALAVINFVIGLGPDEAASVSRIGALARTKCDNGGFGYLGPADIPAIVTGEGGDRRYRSGFGAGEGPVVNASAAPHALAAAPQAARGVGSKRKGGSGKASATRCAAYRDKLRRIDQRMRAGYTAKQGNRLREQRRELWARYARECR